MGGIIGGTALLDLALLLRSYTLGLQHCYELDLTLLSRSNQWSNQWLGDGK